MSQDAAPVATDLSGIPAEDWPAYFFDRPIVEGLFIDNFEVESWVDVDDPERALDSLTRLLLGFGRIGRLYSLEQINQGVWAMWGCDYELHGLFWDEDLPWPARERAIRAMLVPFRDFLAGHPVEVMENCFYMWWDLIQSRPFRWSLDEDGGEILHSAVDAARVRQAYFETLRAILALDDGRCQSAALHGLGHLEHPERAALVQAYIDAQPDLDRYPDGRRWLEQCRDGTVL